LQYPAISNVWEKYSKQETQREHTHFKSRYLLLLLLIALAAQLNQQKKKNKEEAWPLKMD
jgi:hypothetical protein